MAPTGAGTPAEAAECGWRPMPPAPAVADLSCSLCTLQGGMKARCSAWHLVTTHLLVFSWELENHLESEQTPLLWWSCWGDSSPGWREGACCSPQLWAGHSSPLQRPTGDSKCDLGRCCCWKKYLRRCTCVLQQDSCHCTKSPQAQTPPLWQVSILGSAHRWRAPHALCTGTAPSHLLTGGGCFSHIAMKPTPERLSTLLAACWTATAVPLLLERSTRWRKVISHRSCFCGGDWRSWGEQLWGEQRGHVGGPGWGEAWRVNSHQEMEIVGRNDLGVWQLEVLLWSLMDLFRRTAAVRGNYTLAGRQGSKSRGRVKIEEQNWR